MKTTRDRMLDLLLAGESVGTDNTTCRKLRTNQVPDVARALKAKGVDLQRRSKSVTRGGKSVNVVEYYLKQPEITRILQERKAQEKQAA